MMIATELENERQTASGTWRFCPMPRAGAPATAGITVAEVIYPPATEFTQAGQSIPLDVFEQRFAVTETRDFPRHAGRRSPGADPVSISTMRRDHLLRAGSRAFDRDLPRGASPM
jgi:hypothetical protein